MFLLSKLWGRSQGTGVACFQMNDNKKKVRETKDEQSCMTQGVHKVFPILLVLLAVTPLLDNK